MGYYVYWIHKLSHIDILSEGYIGVSNNPKRRFNEHKNSKKNYHLTNALKKYDDLIFDIIFEGSEEECYDLEFQFRPEDHVGWNITTGGGKPFNRMGTHHDETSKRLMSEKKKGKKRKPFSEEWKKNIGESLLGNIRGKANKDRKLPPQSEAHKQAISESKKGKPSPLKGKPRTTPIWNKGKKIKDKEI
jgi:predicted GIY-YIG superfamily endonuclease